MVYFTKYAERKFDILNKHKVFFTKEQIEDTINLPDKIQKKGKYQAVYKDNIGVIYEKKGKLKRVFTFYPVK